MQSFEWRDDRSRCVAKAILSINGMMIWHFLKRPLSRLPRSQIVGGAMLGLDTESKSVENCLFPWTSSIFWSFLSWAWVLTSCSYALSTITDLSGQWGNGVFSYPFSPFLSALVWFPFGILSISMLLVRSVLYIILFYPIARQLILDLALLSPRPHDNSLSSQNILFLARPETSCFGCMWVEYILLIYLTVFMIRKLHILSALFFIWAWLLYFSFI